MENWKKINGFPYYISDKGRIKNEAGQIKVLGKNKGKHKEYLRVRLYNNGQTKKYYVHRLVAEHFLDNWTEDCYVCHKDNDTFNNIKENLIVGTQSLNMKQWQDERKQKRS